SSSLTIVTVASFVARRRGGRQPLPSFDGFSTPYDTTPLLRFSGPVWNLSMYTSYLLGYRCPPWTLTQLPTP
ncbi:hypothetical protein J6590_101005, partial [Homalodisca vitripennis]